MKEELISVITAKLAKEKGFDFSDIEFRDSNTLKIVYNVKSRLSYFGSIKKSNLIQLPTQSLLQKWLRETHNIHVIVKPIINNVTKTYKYTYLIIVTMERAGGYYETYEEALETGLYVALKLMK